MNSTLSDITKEFPILKKGFLRKNLVYLDNAATTQKPQVVIDRLIKYYSEENANIHRGPYDLSIHATEEWEKAHQTVANFINADSYKEIFFVRNSTEGLNFLVNTVGRERLSKDDILVISEMEHHSNIVPWLMLQKELGFKIERIPVKDDYTLDTEWYKELVKKEGSRIKIVSLVHISNVLGVKNPVEDIFKEAHDSGAFTILDAAQSIPHIKVDVKSLNCDALTFSGHKVYGPTGSGAVYMKLEYLERVNPWMGGGEMISTVSMKDFELNELPWRFEAGTPNIAGGIGLGVAIEWFSDTIERVGGWKSFVLHEQTLMNLLLKQFDGIDWFRPFGPTDSSLKYGPMAFTIKGFKFRGCKDVKKSDKDGGSISAFLNSEGIAFREGYHCTEPLHDRFGFGPTLRFSLGIYNTEEDIKYASNRLKQAVLRGLA